MDKIKYIIYIAFGLFCYYATFFNDVENKRFNTVERIICLFYIIICMLMVMGVFDG
ncbi:MAG: hypothetical protein MSA65_03230 [Mollicutes bacterium]|nr:hypothetical protein [Mollicutes bacterium]